MEQDTKIKILVVEDDISLKDSLVRLLQNRDFLVQAVENKQQAVEQIKSGQPKEDTAAEYHRGLRIVGKYLF